MGQRDSYLVAIDQSTQATKALLIEASGRPVRRVTLAHEQIYPGAGLVEHDPVEVLANVRKAVAQLVGESGVSAQSLAGLCITNQRETIVAWDRASGKPVHNALVWQDCRGAELCARLAAEGHEQAIRQKTGLRLDPYFSASKLAWIARETAEGREALRSGNLMAGTMDAWLVWNLTDRKVFATDYSNASRTMLFDIHNLSWDEELLALFGLNGILMPEARSSDAIFGEALFPELALSLPIASVMGDSHAALFGHCGWKLGDAKATYGTGSSIMSNLGPSRVSPGEGLVLSLAWGYKDEAFYVLEGNIHSTGYTIRWLRDNLGLFSSYDEAERLAVEAGGNGGVYLVPAFSGLGAPYWKQGVRALVTGLSHGSDKRHIIRAGLESIAFQVRDLVTEMGERSAHPLAELHVDGGPTRNVFLMQFQADLLGIPVIVPEVEELSALGVAYMGGLALGVWAGLADVGSLPRAEKRYGPRMAADEREALVEQWKSALSQAISRVID
jgi:glycerol kinase